MAMLLQAEETLKGKANSLFRLEKSQRLALRAKTRARYFPALGTGRKEEKHNP